MNQKIGLFGGTFDPVHHGHINIALIARQQLDLDRVVFLPSGIPPHKTNLKISSNLIRKQMVLAAIAPYSFMTCSDFDLNRQTPSYTCDMLRHFHQLATTDSDQLFFLMGQDSMQNLASWRNAETLTNYAKLVVYPRSNSPIQIPGFLNHEDVIILKSGVILISSTQIRTIVKSGGDASDYIPAAVELLIKEHLLYL